MANRVLLDNVTHKDLKVRTGYASEFGDNLNNALVFPTEFAFVLREYPILFKRGGNDELHAVALLGLDEDENLFLDAGQGPGGLSFNEFNPIFNRNRAALLASGLAAGDNTYGGEGVVSAASAWDGRCVARFAAGDAFEARNRSLLASLAFAIVSVVILLAVSLGWREALVVALAVPISFSLALFVNYLFGYTINRVTLFALILSLGLVVDDPITNVDNIQRHILMRVRKPLDATLYAAALAVLLAYRLWGRMRRRRTAQSRAGSPSHS